MLAENHWNHVDIIIDTKHHFDVHLVQLIVKPHKEAIEVCLAVEAMGVPHYVDDWSPVGKTHSREDIIVTKSSPVIVKRIWKVWICSDDESICISSRVVNGANSEYIMISSFLGINVVTLIVCIGSLSAYCKLPCEITELVEPGNEEVLIIIEVVSINSSTNINIPRVFVYSHWVRNRVLASSSITDMPDVISSSTSRFYKAYSKEECQGQVQ